MPAAGVRAEPGVQFDAAGARGGAHPVEHRGDERRHLDRLGRQVDRARRDAAELEQVVDEQRQSIGLDPDRPQVALHVGGVVDHPVLERLGGGPDAGQRAAQVVGHPGDQLAAGAFQCELAFMGLAELARHRAELVAEPSQLADRRSRTALGHVAVRDRSGQLTQRICVDTDPTGEAPRRQDTDAAGGTGDDPERGQVVRLDEHGARRHDGTDPRRDQRRERHDQHLPPRRCAPATPGEPRTEQHHGQRTERGQRDERQAVGGLRGQERRAHGSNRYPPATVTRCCGLEGSCSILERSRRTCTVTVAASP